MNLYLRYFDKETLVNNVDEAIDFLKGISKLEWMLNLEADIRDYAASDVCYPKRYKVRPRIFHCYQDSCCYYAGFQGQEGFA